MTRTRITAQEANAAIGHALDRIWQSKGGWLSAATEAYARIAYPTHHAQAGAGELLVIALGRVADPGDLSRRETSGQPTSP